MNRLKLTIIALCIALTNTVTKPLTIFDALYERNLIIQEQIQQIKLKSEEFNKKRQKAAEDLGFTGLMTPVLTNADESIVKKLEEEFDKNKLLLDAVMGKLDNDFVNNSDTITRVATHLVDVEGTWNRSEACKQATDSCAKKMKSKTMVKVQLVDGYYVPFRNLADAIGVMRNDKSSAHELSVARLAVTMFPTLPVKL